MKGFYTVKVALVLACTLAACSATDGSDALRNETTTSINQKIVDDVTTKEQVRAAFGEPQETSVDGSGHETWKYSAGKFQGNVLGYIPVVNGFAGGGTNSDTTLTLVFRGDRVASHSISQSKSTVESGLLSK
ncbi:hypothetical protein [Nguyenibacter sp. L1]|uniref:hypothetical protein n=1 Tax=Nguyenibacter sp. L1 TaxID=3049350 RepID=UPI002B45CAAB|nr:hypothetical protein [Nguyenibacter sp. L1]WRH89562.1 hypothetical protein QN315_08230 [Nguyenibacter sp. L1]